MRTFRLKDGKENPMTAKEIDKEVKEMKEFRKKIRNNPTLANKILMGTGMYNQNGTLKKQYR